MIIQHGGLNKDSLEFKVAIEWNKKSPLKKVVNLYGNDSVYFWKKFHCMVGYGNQLPKYFVHGKQVDTETADPVWLSHHGYIGAGNQLKNIITNS